MRSVELRPSTVRDELKSLLLSASWHSDGISVLSLVRAGGVDGRTIERGGLAQNGRFEREWEKKKSKRGLAALRPQASGLRVGASG